MTYSRLLRLDAAGRSPRDDGHRSAWRQGRRAAPLFVGFAFLGSLLASLGMAQAQRGSVKELFAPAHRGIVVVAHRGCHNAAPLHHLAETPENSLAALEHCVILGADMMETDVRITADGYLVIMHDATVDRTTDGHGAVAQMTLEEIKKLHLRQNLGGYAEPPTEERVLTLQELLRAAKARITLNLDVKDAIYAEVVDAAVRAGAGDGVNVKTRAGIASPPLAAIEPFVRVPFIPILDAHGSSVAAVAERQVSQGHPAALEMPRMKSDEVREVAAVARSSGVRLFCNTLGDGFVAGVGGDNDALRNPDAVWGWMYRNGITACRQTGQKICLRSVQHCTSDAPARLQSWNSLAAARFRRHSLLKR